MGATPLGGGSRTRLEQNLALKVKYTSPFFRSLTKRYFPGYDRCIQKCTLGRCMSIDQGRLTFHTEKAVGRRSFIVLSFRGEDQISSRANHIAVGSWRLFCWSIFLFLAHRKEFVCQTHLNRYPPTRSINCSPCGAEATSPLNRWWGICYNTSWPTKIACTGLNIRPPPANDHRLAPSAAR